MSTNLLTLGKGGGKPKEKKKVESFAQKQKDWKRVGVQEYLKKESGQRRK